MCKLCSGAPITAQICELDHRFCAPGLPETGLGALGLVLRLPQSQNQYGGESQHHSGEPLLLLRLPELRRRPRLPPLVCQLQKWDAEPLPASTCATAGRTGWPTLASPILSSVLSTACPPGGGACGSHPRGPALRRPQRASGKPACAEMLDSGLAQWRHFRWSLEATARGPTLVGALQTMEEAWPEGEEHMASINALVGLFARNLDLVYSMRTSNHWDGEAARQTFTDAAGRMHWDHVFVTELLSNSSYRPVHDFMMGAEYTAMARVRRALAEVPKRHLKCLKTDCLVMQDEAPLRHRAGAAPVALGRARPSIAASRRRACGACTGSLAWKRNSSGRAGVAASGGSSHTLPGWREPADGLSRTGKTHLARKIVEALRELGDTVRITKTHAAVQNVGLEAQTADHWVRRNVRSGRCSATWLVIELS